MKPLFDDPRTPVGMTGTRRGATKEQLLRFKKLLRKYGATILNHGDALGADEQCHKVAVREGLEITIWPPLDPKYRAFCRSGRPTIKPKGEYLKRNRDIVDSSVIMFGFPAGMEEELRSGTWACIRYAKKVKKPLIIVFPDGSAKGFNLDAL